MRRLDFRVMLPMVCRPAVRRSRSTEHREEDEQVLDDRIQPDGLVRERAETVLEQLNLTARRDVPAGVLSYAEQRALEIGITIAGGADVILLDEPTSGMSRSETEQVVQLIRQVTAGRTLLMVEHDMSVVFDLADRIAVLVYGQIIAHDTPERIRASAAVQEAYLGVAAPA